MHKPVDVTAMLTLKLILQELQAEAVIVCAVNWDSVCAVIAESIGIFYDEIFACRKPSLGS
jgi:hypothetical protein